MYLRTLLAASKCESLGSLINLLIIPTAKEMSGLLCLHKYLKLPTICLKRVGLTCFSSEFDTSFNPVSIGVTAALQFNMLNLFNISVAYFF
ncbi:hypothetical protein Fmac_015821 [Flemingia macrophylla]|uniref:Uncharacterized protein n=1 Tax=Flemingia macrophylla TaxID=520843 RepID=A0ABD1MGH8_9FABA